MASQKERRERRESAADRRARTHSSGYTTTTLNMPEGLGFYEWKAGKHRISIVGFTCSDRVKEYAAKIQFADPGMMYYEQTYFRYQKIGAAEDAYVCMSQTFGEKDYIQDWKNRNNPDKATLDALKPKQRQLFLVYDWKEPEKGLQLLDCSFHLFGKLLDSRLRNRDEDEDFNFFYELNEEDHRILKITAEEESAGSYSFVEAKSIDFLPLGDKEIPKCFKHDICLNDLPAKVEYKAMRDIFLNNASSDDDGDGDDDDEDTKPSRSRPKDEDKKSKSKSEDDDEDDDDDKKPSSKKNKEKEEEDDDDDKKVTAEDRGIEVGTKVEHETHGVCTVVHISKDGSSLRIEDEDEDIHKAISPADVKVVKSDKKKSKDEDDDKEEKKVSKEDCKKAGAKARRDGKKQKDNPWKKDSEQGKAWNKGWVAEDTRMEDEDDEQDEDDKKSKSKDDEEDEDDDKKSSSKKSDKKSKSKDDDDDDDWDDDDE